MKLHKLHKSFRGEKYIFLSRLIRLNIKLFMKNKTKNWQTQIPSSRSEGYSDLKQIQEFIHQCLLRALYGNKSEIWDFTFRRVIFHRLTWNEKLPQLFLTTIYKNTAGSLAKPISACCLRLEKAFFECHCEKGKRFW